MIHAERTDWLCENARAAGFDLCGVAPVESFAELEKFPEWLARGYAGDMHYLQDVRRRDPQLVLPGARSLIVVALNYNSPFRYSTKRPPGENDDTPRGWISRYAWGDDYHDVIKEKLDSLVAEMRRQFPEPFDARTYVDTGPILERVAAKYAGLGWLGKNTCLINQRLGSWLFLGVIITTLEFEPTLGAAAAPPADLCGSCTRCLDACPTQAFPEPYVLDARRCVSYLTIELRNTIPEELRAAMGDAVIGCDICQDVCPWNRKAPITDVPAFQPRLLTQGAENWERLGSLFHPELEWLASLTPQEFSTVFRKSAAKRAKWRGMVRNACVALGNSGLSGDSKKYRQVVAVLKKLAASDDALISEHAQWALARLSATTAQRTSR
jgi:epoxyqueuosine reductase